MGTKKNPGDWDCYQQAEEDEPIFTLLARDPLAPILVSLWAALREQDGESVSKVVNARSVAVSMHKWRRLRISSGTIPGQKLKADPVRIEDC